eukprot:5460778-Lingulodinium_polyedra.AAC.1
MGELPNGQTNGLRLQSRRYLGSAIGPRKCGKGLCPGASQGRPAARTCRTKSRRLLGCHWPSCRS